MNQNFEFRFVTERPIDEVFGAINDVRGWWNSEMKGDSTHLNDEFSVQFWDLHFSKQKLIEFVPDKKVVWLVVESELTFLRDMEEWTGTKISFELVKKEEGTEVRFTHEGLVPIVQCYNDCKKGWTEYLGSLIKYITTGKGQPYVENAKANA